MLTVTLNDQHVQKNTIFNVCTKNLRFMFIFGKSNELKNYFIAHKILLVLDFYHV